jgi:hypothetical protein
LIWGGSPSQVTAIAAAAAKPPVFPLSARGLSTLRSSSSMTLSGVEAMASRVLATFTGQATLRTGTILALVGNISSGVSGQVVPLATLTLMRGRISAGVSAAGNVTVPPATFPLVGQITAGGKAPAGLQPSNVRLLGQITAGSRIATNVTGTSSIPVFPTVPIGFPLSMTPSFANVDGMTPPGRQMRAPQQQLPIWNFELNFEVLRDQTQNAQSYAELAGFTEFTRLASLFIASVGQYGQFLFDVWWDDSRANQPLGIGDGHNKDFLLQRTWGYDILAFTEPVGALNVLTSVAIDNVVQFASTYSVSKNIVTFIIPPSPGAQVTATFSYYYLCQFSDDQQDYSEFLKNRSSTKIKFRSVLPEVPLSLLTFPFLLKPRTPPVPRTPGFYYFEVSLDTATVGRLACVGIANSNFILGPPPGHQNPYDAALNAQQPNSAFGCCPLWGSPTSTNAYGYPVRGPKSFTSSPGDVVGVAVDTVNKLMWIRNCTVNPNLWRGGTPVLPSPNPVGSVNGFDFSVNIPSGDVFILIGCAWNPFETTEGPISVTLNAGASAFAATIPTDYVPWDVTGDTTINPNDTDFDLVDGPNIIVLGNGNLTMTCNGHIGGSASFIGSTHGRSTSSKQQA